MYVSCVYIYIYTYYICMCVYYIYIYILSLYVYVCIKIKKNWIKAKQLEGSKHQSAATRLVCRYVQLQWICNGICSGRGQKTLIESTFPLFNSIPIFSIQSLPIAVSKKGPMCPLFIGSIPSCEKLCGSAVGQSQSYALLGTEQLLQIIHINTYLLYISIHYPTARHVYLL